MSRFKEPQKVVSISIEGFEPFDVENLNMEDVTIVDEHPDRLLVRYGGRNIEVKILEKDFQNGYYRLRLNGKTFNCKAHTNLDLLIKELGFNQVKKTHEREIFAPMPGMVIDVQVTDGTEVVEDQILLTLEAMKMENIIKSPQAGVIEKIHILQGDKVEKNQLLITFRKEKS